MNFNARSYFGDCIWQKKVCIKLDLIWKYSHVSRGEERETVAMRYDICLHLEQT